MEETFTTVIIIGAGPAGLACSACLNRFYIPNIVLEREDCFAPLWKKKAYDRLKLHIAKEFCELPYMPFPPDASKYVPKDGFVAYLNNYVTRFAVYPKCNRKVDSACYIKKSGMWRVVAKNKELKRKEVYVGRFLVAATGENSEGLVPEIPGLNKFSGDYIHSSDYVNGKKYEDKEVLVVGCGNSGMEIAYDLYNWHARPSIVVRSPVHIFTKEIIWISMVLLKVLSVKQVDKIAVRLGKIAHGDLTKYGIRRPKEGPFSIKNKTGRSATIDVGCVKKIKKRQIKVLPSIKCIDEKRIEFIDGQVSQFNSIIFATGYKSTVKYWLKGGEDLFGEDGMPKKSFPDHWKGEKGLYCVGFARQGLLGISNDAKKISEDINIFLSKEKENHKATHK